MLAISGVLGCSSEAGLSGLSSERVAAGRLVVPLITADEQRYRLRNATFEIRRRGAVVAALSSEASPAATALEAELTQDTYTITLRDGWRLERLEPDGSASAVHAALLTPNPSELRIVSGAETRLVYAFTTVDGVVEFGTGTLRVSVDVVPRDGLEPCSLLERSTCPSGQTCLLADSSGATFCAAPGTLPVGSPCSAEQCVAGAQCLRLDPLAPGAGVCTRFCNPRSSACGCRSLDFDLDLGICTSSEVGVLFSAELGVFDACPQWLEFTSALGSSTFSRVTLSGSLGGAVECSDPLAAAEICAALASGGDVQRSFACDGHSWSVGECGGPELSVDTGFCSCQSQGNTVRPCNGVFGGVGTDTCANITQQMEVACE